MDIKPLRRLIAHSTVYIYHVHFFKRDRDMTGLELVRYDRPGLEDGSLAILFSKFFLHYFIEFIRS
jgi:hypothetical protein